MVQQNGVEDPGRIKRLLKDSAVATVDAKRIAADLLCDSIPARGTPPTSP